MDKLNEIYERLEELQETTTNEDTSLDTLKQMTVIAVELIRLKNKE